MQYHSTLVATTLVVEIAVRYLEIYTNQSVSKIYETIDEKKYYKFLTTLSILAEAKPPNLGRNYTFSGNRSLIAWNLHDLSCIRRLVFGGGGQ